MGVFVCGGTKVYRVVDNRLDGTQLQNNLDVLGDWAVKQQMNFNVEKCKFVHYIIIPCRARAHDKHTIK